MGDDDRDSWGRFSSRHAVRRLPNPRGTAPIMGYSVSIQSVFLCCAWAMSIGRNFNMRKCLSRDLLLGTALCVAASMGAVSAVGQSAGQDMKNAGHETSNAAKDT